jgi:hypothetical protein
MDMIELEVKATIIKKQISEGADIKYIKFGIDDLKPILSEIEINLLCLLGETSGNDKVKELRLTVEELRKVANCIKCTDGNEISKALNFFHSVGIIEYFYDVSYFHPDTVVIKFNYKVDFPDLENMRILMPTILYLRLLAEKASKEL